MLCTEPAGQLATRRIVCPYHQWSYTLQGRLVGVPFIGAANKLTDEDLSLYHVAVREWGGSVFVNLALGEIRPFEQTADPNIHEFDHWPLAELVTGHTFQTTIQCNWKIFWENYMECYHCPSVHPELCDLVPLYKQALSSKVVKTKKEPSSPGVRAGAETWSMDGLIHIEKIADLSEEERILGYKFLTCLPTMFMVAHPDYVRIVSLLPLSPETTQLTAEWLFSPSTLHHPDFNLKNVTDFATLVMEQDARVCELNQRGLRAIPHRQGILVPHEAEVYHFQQWVRSEMGEH
jgi:Rieske 2Fe-2S family protein